MCGKKQPNETRNINNDGFIYKAFQNHGAQITLK